MSAIYFKFVASYTKEEYGENNEPKIVKHKDTYLTKSTLLYTDAEAKATSEIEKIGGKGEINIDTLVKTKIINVYDNFEGDFYEVTVCMHWEDDKGKPKKQSHIDLVKGLSIKDAIENIEEKYSDSVEEYTITKVVESKILDVFH